MEIFEWTRTKIKEYERRYQLDFSYIIKNEFWVYLRQSILLVVGVAIPVAFARLASKEVFGLYNFLLAILAMMSLFSMPGLNTAVLQSVARGYDESFKKAVKIRFLWSLLGIPALLSVGAYYYYYNTQILGICLMMSTVFFPFIYAPNTWDSFLQGKKRFDLTAKYGSFQATSNATAMIAILFLNPSYLVLIFATYLVTNAFLNCLLFLKSQRYIESGALDKECMGYGYFMTTTNIVGTIARNVDRILIGSLLGSSELAVYAIAIVVSTKIANILKLSWSPFTPKFCQDEVEIGHILEKIKRFIIPLLLVVLGGSLLYWLFIDDVILLLFGEKYINSIIYSKPLLFMILVSIPNVFLGTFAIAKKKRKSIILGYHIYPFLKLLIMCSFIYLWGIMGAVWGLNLSMTVQMFLILVGMRSRER